MGIRREEETKRTSASYSAGRVAPLPPVSEPRICHVHVDHVCMYWTGIASRIGGHHRAFLNPALSCSSSSPEETFLPGCPWRLITTTLFWSLYFLLLDMCSRAVSTSPLRKIQPTPSLMLVLFSICDASSRCENIRCLLPIDRLKRICNSVSWQAHHLGDLQSGESRPVHSRHVLGYASQLHHMACVRRTSPLQQGSGHYQRRPWG
jgi:hypothetical protein